MCPLPSVTRLHVGAYTFAVGSVCAPLMSVARLWVIVYQWSWCVRHTGDLMQGKLRSIWFLLWSPVKQLVIFVCVWQWGWELYAFQPWRYFLPQWSNHDTCTMYTIWYGEALHVHYLHVHVRHGGRYRFALYAVYILIECKFCIIYMYKCRTCSVACM